MCDTIVIVAKDRVLFAKNSDRDANEGQNLEWYPRRGNGKDARLKCTYVEIADVEEAFATVLSRPFWMWGAEMGANECGVVVGNEAVFTKAPCERVGLLGMDLVRLALERAATAEEGCSIITRLLEEHGQGGGCGHENRKFMYHNSFIVADCREAYVLETAGREWAIEKVEGARSISNGLTIGGFADKHSDFVKTRASGCRVRRQRTQGLAEDATEVGDLFSILRDHGPDTREPKYSFINGGLNAPCVHGGGVATSSQTTASWVAELTGSGAQHWVTATAAPCVGLFKPVSVLDPVDVGPRAEDVVNDSLWWRHERFHRAVMGNPKELMPLFVGERDEVEGLWLASPPDSQHAFHEGDRLLAKWSEAVAKVEVQDLRPFWTRRYWEKRNARAGLATEPLTTDSSAQTAPLHK